jgi:hypothetical protein
MWLGMVGVLLPMHVGTFIVTSSHSWTFDLGQGQVSACAQLVKAATLGHYFTTLIG